MDYAAILVFVCTVNWILSPIYGEEVNLMDTRLATTDLNWLTFPSDGSGWNELSNADENGVPFRTFQVCNTRTPGQDNWFSTNYIPLESGIKNIYVEVKFIIKSCQDLPNIATCKETFNLYVLETNSSEVVGEKYFKSGKYKKVDTIAANQRFHTDSNEASVETRRIGPIKSNGVYLAFQDTGGCMIIYYVRVYHKRCGQTVNNLAIFPPTLTGSSTTSLVKSRGQCVNNAIWKSENEEGPKLHCNSDGEWKLPEGSCQCLPGYEPDDSMTGCVLCNRYQFKPSFGNTKCSKCPAYSATNSKGSVECACNLGYYRASADEPTAPCTRPPSEPQMIQYEVKDTSVKMKWSPPTFYGGRNDVHYGVSCETCDSTYSRCTDCGEGVKYEPNVQIHRRPEVSIIGLSAHTYYRFRVSSYNGVSSISATAPAYADATLKTSEPAPAIVPSVSMSGSSHSTVSLTWASPLNTHGNIEEYEIQINSLIRNYPPYSKSFRTKLRRIKIDGLPSKTAFLVKVRARNEAGFGPFSSPVRVATSRAPSSPFQGSQNIENSPVMKTTEAGNSHGDVTKQSSSYLTAAVIIAVVCVGIIAVLVILFVVRMKQRSEKGDGCEDVEVYPFFANAADLLHSQRGQHSYIDPTSYTNPSQAILELTREIDACNVKRDILIGSGDFGDVYKGYLRPTSFIYDGTLTTTLSSRAINFSVAVKVLKEGASEEQINEFLEEALVVGQFHHPNIVRLEGVVSRIRPPMIIFEFMENGSLDKYLEYQHLSGADLDSLQLVHMLRDIAEGMRYLSEMGYVHRDLSARNILVNDQLVCKVSDFGLSKFLEDVDEGQTAMYTNKSGLVPIRWTAPEAISERTFTSASDVWSYGIVMWEVLTHGERPYWQMPNRDVVHCLDCGYRLPPPSFCPRILHNVMLNCWNIDRTRRPTFKQIVSQLDNVIILPEKLQDTINNIPITEQPECIPERLDISSLCQWLEDMNMTRYRDIMLRHGHVTAEQIVRLSINQLDEMGITDQSMQRILLNGADLLRHKLQEVSIIGIGITV